MVEGDIAFLDAPEPILAFVRRCEGQSLLVAFNLSPTEATWTMPVYTDARTIEDHDLTSGRIADGKLVLPPRGVYFARI